MGAFRPRIEHATGYGKGWERLFKKYGSQVRLGNRGQLVDVLSKVVLERRQ